MLRNYFKIAVRNLLKNKVFSMINILGLAVGMACCFLIALYVYHHTSYDRFHEHAEKIVRVTMEFGPEESARKVSVTGTKVLPEFKRTFPEVQNGVRIFTDNAIVKYEDKIFDEEGFAYADSTFFSVFSFHLLEGNPARALTNPNSVILTRSMAKKYFGDETPVGRSLRIDNSQDYLITGIMEDCPANSQIKFNFLASFSSLEVSKTEQWWDASHFTYLLLQRPEDIQPLQNKIFAYMKKIAGNTVGPGNSHLTFFLEPFLEVHLYSAVEGGLEPAGDYRYIYIFSAIALLILGIACANYINLTTARAVDRAKEVGVRKVMGAVRKELIRQFIGESAVLVFVAFAFSVVIVQALLPLFNTLSAEQLTVTAMLRPVLLGVFCIIILILGLLGGGYPALVLSKFNPGTVLKGSYRSNASGVLLRRILIVFQFVISICLITSTLVIRDQLNFIQNRKLGYDTNHILALPVDDQMRDRTRVLRNELETNPDILSVTVASRTPVEVTSTASLHHDNREMIVNQIRTDRHFIKTLGIKIISGSDFTEADEMTASDNVENEQSIMLNESAIKELHWSAEEAVGRSVGFRGRMMKIKAVVEDFHFVSMHRPITPLVIFIGSYVSKMMVKLSGENLSQTVQFINTKWSTLFPDHPFTFEFLDDQFNDLYATETRTSSIFYSFALLAIALACMGLLGLVSFIAQQRTKEIGIRKVLGANVVSIMLLLSRDQLKLVVLALIIAIPVTYLGIEKWLNSFAYHLELSWWVFLTGGAAAIFIALLIVSMQSVKAALANPVNSLRNE